ncbi:ABC transporter permease [Micromonospora olivasterospora]|uniref:Ribose transport system permease protein n=1 Tax=Micromonospora olivasterospora TaxID=1880 RepID=A0A562IIY2_MICOL|nr:ribose transport system permease protein [Micromonospora olivasterospora]
MNQRTEVPGHEASRVSKTVEIPSRQLSGAKAAVVDFLSKYALVAGLVGLTLYFAISPQTSETFSSWTNVQTIVASESVVGIVALAALVPLVAFRFDLSLGANVTVSAIATAHAVANWEVPTAVGVIIGISTGALIGLVNGLLVSLFQANSLVITLGTATLLSGLSALFSGYDIILGVSDSMTDFGATSFLGIPKPAWLLLICVLAVTVLLRYTVAGRQFSLIGSNEKAAKLVGVPVSGRVAFSFVVAGALAGVAAVLLVCRTGSASTGIGEGFMLPALAAVFLGSTTIKPGRFTVAGAIVGVFFVAVAVNGLTLAGVDDWVEPTFTGAVVVVAVALSAVLMARSRGARL